MALTTCPDCGREVSDAAPACPQCGRPLKGAGIATTPARDWAVKEGLSAANAFGGVILLGIIVFAVLTC